MAYLIVPDDDPKKEFKVEDVDEAHRLCRERGHEKFDVWSIPYKHETMAYAVTGPNGEDVGLIGDIALARQGGLPPGFTAKEAIWDDGATMLQTNIKTKKEVE